MRALVIVCALVAAACGAEPTRSARAPDICFQSGLTGQQQVDRCSEVLATNLTTEQRGEALHTRGFAYWRELGENERAMADFDAAVALDYQSASLYFNRGRLRVAVEQFEPAVEDFERAAQINPTWSDPLSWSARTRADHLGDSEGALADINRAIERAPHDANLIERRCEIEAKTRRLDDGTCRSQ